jgi:WD40 repeat protein
MTKPSGLKQRISFVVSDVDGIYQKDLNSNNTNSKEFDPFKGHLLGVNSLALDQDKYLYSAGRDGRVISWKLEQNTKKTEVYITSLIFTLCLYIF